MSNRTTENLFKTNAIRVAPADTPFWYTSGKFGPFYINTHFLIKDEGVANDVLRIIEDECAADKEKAPKIIFEVLDRQYNGSETYRDVIEELVEVASRYDFDFISGGERRDFFFSMLVAHLMDKPHLTIYKDLSTTYTDSDFNPLNVPITGKTGLHIADLITEASSYERAWVPAIRDVSASINNTIAVVDRHQNGAAVLRGLGITMETLTGVDKALFDEALSKGYIDNAQYDLVIKFLENPDKYMKDFVASHPTFIEDQIKLGGKNAERAKLALEKGFVS
ncbi:MAG: orotate phosphoribosyltransferase [Clostridiales bacterium]|nr:orotate phosphoribosyltransferase [Clostridiales bacterium]